MVLLDISLQWIHHYGPRVLDLFDDVEAFYESECLRARSLDRLASPSAIVSLRCGLSRFLNAEDARGVVPHGCHQLVKAATGRGCDIARNILAGRFTQQSRAAAISWLAPKFPIDDSELYRAVRDRLAEQPQWSATWPYSLSGLSELIGVGSEALRSFLGGRAQNDVGSLARIERFLVAHGAMSPIASPAGESVPTYRSDRGIEARLTDYVSNHPLNQESRDGGPWPLQWNLTNGSRDGALSLYEALRYCIPSAVRVALGVFQARRESELSSLTTHCVSEEKGNLWLESHIAKSLRRDKKLPTVPTIADAVALLDRWSARGREQNGTALLFSHWEPLGKALSVVKPNLDLNRFAKMVMPFPLSEPLQVRQFRRFFAVTFMWRYRLPNLPALSDFLCHSGLTMTWAYVTERVGTSVMREAQAEFSKEILVGAATGRVRLHGAFGRTWHRWVEKVRAQVRRSIEFVDSPAEADRMFMQHVEAGVRMLTPTPGGVCAAGSRERDNRRAMCKVPDPEAPGRHIKKPELAQPAHCARCPFSATDEAHRTYWLSVAQEARSAAVSSVPSVVRERARKDAPTLERIAAQFTSDRTPR